MTVDERDIERGASEKLYPAPLAGVEPLPGHIMDPDGEERFVEDAELKAREEHQATLASGHESSQELVMSNALLGALEGAGLLREVRAADGEIASVPGSWRPRDSAVTTLDGLKSGDSVSFEGSLHKADGTVEHVRSDVTVTSVGDYKTEAGERLVLVNFEAAVPGMLAHAEADN